MPLACKIRLSRSHKMVLSMETQVTSETQIIGIMASIRTQDFHCLVKETGGPFENFSCKNGVSKVAMPSIVSSPKGYS